MRATCHTKCLLLFFALSMSILTQIQSSQAQGIALDASLIAQVNKATCGFVHSQWIPGSRLKNGSFLPLTTKIASLAKNLKKKNLSSQTKEKIRKQIKKLKKALKSDAGLCASLSVGIPTPGPTPTSPSNPATPLPGATSVAWSVSALDLGGGVGTEALLFCPANPVETLRSIFGNDIYTADSPICVAALHLGLFNRNVGGNVKIRVKPGAPYYLGSIRNGIKSTFYGSAYDLSFVFLDIGSGVELITNTIPNIDFAQTAQPVYTYVDQQFTFSCPSGIGQTRSIWGTDVYTYDSSICTAAVHAGRISLQNGGIVTIQIRPGAGSYAGSSRNGISSNSYGAWGGSYIFVP